MKAKSTLAKSLLSLLFLLLITACPAATGKIIYVDDDGPADFSTIQAAIDDANDGDTVIVAAGTYTGEGNRDIDFKGKAITVKGEEGPQKCIIDCQGTEEDKHRGFYFHSGEDANSVIQGITITNGFVGDGGAIFCEGSSPTICECIIRSNTAQVQYGMDYEGSGGGIYCNYSEALIKDCIIIDNSANPRWLQVSIGGRGGGVYCSNSNLTITGCEISKNSSALDQSGAVYCWISNITINTCISNDNQSNGIYMYRGNLEITDSLIANNKCSGIIYYSEGNEAIVKNCDILKNRWDGLNFYNIEDILIERCLITANKHAGIFERGTNELTVNNCTITNNRMRGIYCGAINCKISNSIIWENRILLSPSSIVDNPLCTISYSNVQGALESVGIVEGYSLKWGEGNINLDPNFASPGHWDPNGIPWTYEDDIWIEGDYHLKSQAGRWDPNSQSWVQDDVTSPCIDAGDPNLPVGDEPMPNGGRINMGAYGGTPEASKSYFNDWSLLWERKVEQMPSPITVKVGQLGGLGENLENREWLMVSTQYHQIYFQQSTDEGKIAELYYLIDNIYEFLQGRSPAMPEPPIKAFIVPDQWGQSRCSMINPAMSTGDQGDKIFIFTSLLHEETHLFNFAFLNGKAQGWWAGEFTCIYFQTRAEMQARGKNIKEEIAAKLPNGPLYPLGQIGGAGRDAFDEAFSVLFFFEQSYGFEALNSFRQACLESSKATNVGELPEAVFCDVFGKDIQSLEEEWLDFYGWTSIPVVSPVIDQRLMTEVSFFAEKASVQSIVMDIAEQAGLGYNWTKSYYQTYPVCSKYIWNVRIDNVPLYQALIDILDPQGLTYRIEEGKIVLYLQE